MRRILAIVLCLAMLCTLCACSQEKEIRFYYARKDVVYGEADGVIASEVRDVTGHEQDLAYLLMLYLEGPHADTLTAPYPRGTSLSHLEIQDGTITVLLSSAFGHLQGLDHTIACACIAYTCFGVSDCDSVTIKSKMPGSGTMTLTRDSVILADMAETN